MPEKTCSFDIEHTGHILPRTERIGTESMRETVVDHSLAGGNMKTYRWTKQPRKKTLVLRLTEKQIDKLYEKGKVVRRF